MICAFYGCGLLGGMVLKRDHPAFFYYSMEFLAMASINPTARLSELDAVNSVLANIGQSPVNSLTDSSVDI